MPLRQWLSRAQPLPGSPGAARLPVDAGDWLAAAGDVAAAGGQLLALSATPAAQGACVRAALLQAAGLLVCELEISTAEERYPGLQRLFPAAARMQRFGPRPELAWRSAPVVLLLSLEAYVYWSVASFETMP